MVVAFNRKPITITCQEKKTFCLHEWAKSQTGIQGAAGITRATNKTKPSKKGSDFNYLYYVRTHLNTILEYPI